MPYRHYDALTPQQQAEIRALRPNTVWSDFEFWVKPDGHMSRRGGHHQLTEAAYQREMARFTGSVRSKGDLRDWAPSVRFTISRG